MLSSWHLKCSLNPPRRFSCWSVTPKLSKVVIGQHRITRLGFAYALLFILYFHWSRPMSRCWFGNYVVMIWNLLPTMTTLTASSVYLTRPFVSSFRFCLVGRVLGMTRRAPTPLRSDPGWVSPKWGTLCTSRNVCLAGIFAGKNCRSFYSLTVCARPVSSLGSSQRQHFLSFGLWFKW